MSHPLRIIPTMGEPRLMTGRRRCATPARVHDLRYRQTGVEQVLRDIDDGGVVALAGPAGAHPNVDQGYFAEGLVASLAAAAGLDVQWPRLGHRIDLGLFLPGPKGTSGSKQIDLQVKSWSTGQLNADGHFHYPLEIPAFNYLAGHEHDVRHYLVLCVVPPQVGDYADAQHNRLRLRHAAYWLSLRDKMPDPTLNPTSTKTVLVPAKHLLTTTTIRALVEDHEHMAVVL